MGGSSIVCDDLMNVLFDEKVGGVDIVSGMWEVVFVSDNDCW